MSRELFRLGEKLFDRPQLCTSELMSHTVEYVAKRCGDPNFSIHDSDFKGKRSDRVRYDKENAVGYISMDGPITYVPMYGMSTGEALSHKLIKEEVQNLLDKGASTIVLDQDSGGGEAYQTFETANFIRNLCDEYGAKLVAYVDGISASASYAYTSVAHESIMNPQARVGSIGVVLRLRNFNKYMEKMGVEDTYIFAGDSKIPFDEEGDWTEEFKNEMQESVNELYEEFTDHVAMWRGVSQDTVKGTQAKMFSSKKALELGLVDAVMTVEDFRSYLSDSGEEKEDKKSTKRMAIFSKKEEDSPDMANKLTELQTQVESLTTSLAEVETSLAEANDKVTSLQEQLESKDAQLTEALAEANSLKEEMQTNKATSRKEKMAAVVGAEQAESLEDIYSELSDDKFDKYLKSYEAQAKVEEDSAMFNELGEEGDDKVTTSEKQEKKALTAPEILAKKYNTKGDK